MSYEKQTWNKYDDLKTEEENIENGAVVTDNRMNHMETGIGDNDANLASHLVDKNNPHKVTAAQVGLGNIQNFGLATEDEAKQAISNAKYMTPSLTQAVLSANINSIAYANSADGTDGFTTVYPNLNLLNNTIITSESLTSKNWSAELGSSLSVGSNNGIKVVNNGGIIGSTGGFGYGPTVNVKAGDTITVSYYVKNTGAAEIKNFSLQIAFYGSSNTYLGNNKLVIPNDGKPYFFSFTTTVPNGASTARPRWFDRATAVNEQHIFEVYGMKTEQGSTATPHMPSASEVTTADWPKYIGFSNTVKTNKSASDYTWFPVKDSELTNKVESHINNKANPHAVTASQVGAYSKSESDSKLTALENKSISNKGNLKKGDDLNDITATGFYRIGGFVGGTEILNVPTELSGVKFYAFVTVTEAIQELTVYAPINSTTWTYSRSISGTKPTWSSWSKTVMADDSGKVKLTDFEVTTISETVNIGNGLSLNFQRKGEFVLVRFSGSLTAINSGTYFSTAVPEQWRPDGIKELIGHFASGALAFHVDLETDGRVKWWGDSRATGAARGTAMYFLK